MDQISQGMLWELYIGAGKKASEQGNYNQAERMFSSGLRALEQHLADLNGALADMLHCLANVYREQGRHSEAEPLYQRALGMLEIEPGRESLGFRAAALDYAQMLRKVGRTSDAEGLEAPVQGYERLEA